MRAFEQSLRKLGLDEADLFLIHWPVPARDLYVQTWQTLEKIRAEGRARSIGVSNFTENHLSRLMRKTEVWSPIGRGRGLLEDQKITRLVAEKQGRRRRWCCAGTCNWRTSPSPSP